MEQPRFLVNSSRQTGTSTSEPLQPAPGRNCEAVSHFCIVWSKKELSLEVVMEQSRTVVQLPGWSWAGAVSVSREPEEASMVGKLLSSTSVRSSITALTSTKSNKAPDKEAVDSSQCFKDCLENTNLTWTSLSNMQGDLKRIINYFPCSRSYRWNVFSSEMMKQKRESLQEIKCWIPEKVQKTELSDSENLHRAGVCCYGKHHLRRR